MSKDELTNLDLSAEEQYLVRVEKIKKMQEIGWQPWPAVQPVNHTTQQVFEDFKVDQSTKYQVAGRLVSLRWHGQTAFATIQDRAGRLQIYLRRDVLGAEKFDQLMEFLDLGDYVWGDGPAFQTKTGEITLRVQQLELISKCLHPLPEKFHGLTDTETRYRQRYLDLISNPESRARFLKRSQIISTIRHFLEGHEFVEVETPMLHPIAGGALAKPFVTHHNALDDEFYLRIAPELYLKRLVVGGVERVFEINRNFRNEGISTRHNPEFTMLEFYMAHQDYRFGMDFVEQMLQTVVKAVCNVTKVAYGEHEIEFGQPFERLSLETAILKYTSYTALSISSTHIDETLKLAGVECDLNLSHAHKMYLLFDQLVEPKLIQPTFLVDFPIEVSPLSKRDVHNPALAARFELFVGGMELANAFNELNDPFDQAERFKAQLEAHRTAGEEAHAYDADYIRALEYGLPPTLGVGIGIDRLTMLLTNTTSIRDVILFPTLKKK